MKRTIVGVLSVSVLAACGAARTSMPSPEAAPATPSQPAGEIAGPVLARIEVSPSRLTMAVGGTATVSAQVFGEDGSAVDTAVTFFSSSRRRLGVNSDGEVTAYGAGSFTVIALVRGSGLRGEVSVEVTPPPIAEVEILAAGERFFAGGSLRHAVRVSDTRGVERGDVAITWDVDDPAIASVDQSGLMTAHTTGRVTLLATADGVTGEHTYEVVQNPIRTFEISSSTDSARTGDVVHLMATALDGRGRIVTDAPIIYTLVADVEDTVIAQSPPAEIDRRGRFVAQKAGNYTIIAITPGHTAYRSISITNRNVTRRVELVGRAPVRDVHTSDLWVWEGQDGGDYMITGTWGGNGVAYFWDVTDPANQLLVDSVVVDARTVNDVKISEDGTIAVISREGASDRRNGLIILDVSDPRNVSIVSTFDDELTGGVHNVFVHDGYIYAVNNGRRYDIIDIRDPANPHRVGRFELDNPGHFIHDVWVNDGIAYSSNWADGVVLVDVGNGIAGGSPENPVRFASYAYPLGRAHAAFPYRSQDGRFYVFIGDEIFPSGLNTGRGGTPNRAAGYIHIVDFTDPANPEEVARYEVPEAGSHNFWIEDDMLYAAFYNGGLRVVDVSGELMGNLYYQGREIANLIPYDPEGFVPNAPFTWGPQPFKGNVFFSDWNSGVWTVKLLPQESLTQ